MLVVHPGASWATAEVYDGLTGAWRRAGHELVPYALGYWLEVAGQYLKVAYEQALKQTPDIEKPTDADVVYWASREVVPVALRHEPDWVVLVSAMYLHPDILPMLQRCGFRVAAILTESPYDDGPQARLLPYIDVAFTNERSSVPFLRQVSEDVYYLPHAYDPSRHHPSPPDAGEADVPSHDVVFVGTGFAERVALLESVDWTGIDLGLYGAWSLTAEDSPLRPHIRGGIVPNTQAAALYRRAKIGLNLYRHSYGYGHEAPQVNTGESLNPRALELAANGVFTISDKRPEVEEVFGDAVPTFETAEELGGLIRYYLAHEGHRREMAGRLPQLVAARTFDTTAQQVMTVLEQYGEQHG